MTIVEVQNVSLSYPIYGANARSFKHSMINLATGGRLGKEGGGMLVEALKDVSFCLAKGDRLALIGHNGAGKSSLLKVLADIYEPTQGKVRVKGQVNCLFDIMMGMEPDMSGYENIRLRAIILGLSDQKIQEIIPQIEDFAELGDFMKMPIKSYSAGMKLRLAFGIITSVPSEILLIDEIVNVGDAGFVEKAKARMKSLVYQSDVMVLSTHDISMVREFCNKALWLEQGKIKAFDEIENVLKIYTA